MPFYHKAGEIPPKRHTTFEKPNGGLYQEELFGTAGFAGMSSLLYHLNPPTQVEALGEAYSVRPEIAIEENMKALRFSGFDIQPEADYIRSRKTLFVNNDLHIGLAAPTQFSDGYFYKNADADEMIFIHQGSGVLHSQYGSINFEYGDYLVIPRGTIYQLEFNDANNRLLYVESFSPILTPN